MTMNGIQMPGMAPSAHATDDLGAPSPSVAAISLVLLAVICLVAARHARQLRVALVNRRAWPAEPAQELGQRVAGVLLTPELSLGCQLAMSGTMIYLLVLMI
jgi:hypothetical protein